ncbi:hypothetical protein ASF61_07060 [Duganella sp. Leaf126]|uniref:siderophore-iron reductase FhuF n=1 Tax=Duganella sp. Leaf126 TaxID=1736266 RepID=UPI0006F95F6F|nr:siderophore-iron reductase FhuF [Duganella sp. Leaf126]KQQ35971.1 hypothetical protein ASF61_07060 [Duganella sp. Leaf126]
MSLPSRSLSAPAGASLPGPLADLFPGDLAAYAAALTVAEAPAPYHLTLAALLDGPGLAAALARYATNYPGAHAKAVASTWSKLYFNALLVPVLAASAACGWCFPLSPRSVVLRTGADGAPERFILTDEGAAQPGLDAAARLLPLVRGHLAPVVEAIARDGRLAPRLVWNNAAVIAEQTLLQCQTLLGDAPRIAGDLAFLCATETWPDRLANPLFRPTQVVDGVRQRRLCCLRYRLRLDFCADCPLDCTQRAAAQRKAG